MLYLIGLGLSWKDLSMKALEAINTCDKLYLETYTSLADFSSDKLKRLTGKKVIELDRKGVEEEKQFLEDAKSSTVALLIFGDPLSATTHFEILLEAKKLNIEIEVIHCSSIMTVISETGLFLYRFGKTASIPIPEKGFEPESFFDILEQNLSIDAHTLFLLDLKPDQKKFMTIKQAIDNLLKVAENRNSKLFSENTFCIGCARLGQKGQIIKAGKAKDIQKLDFGKPPYCLIVPSKLNFKEEEALNNLKL